MIEKEHDGSGVKGFDFLKIVKMLSVEWPPYVVDGILGLLFKREEENVEFEEFLSGVKTVLLYDNYFEEMETVFKHLDVKKEGKINKDELVEAIKKLRSEEIAKLHDLRVPDPDDFSILLSGENYADPDINYDDFLVACYKCTLDNLGDRD